MKQSLILIALIALTTLSNAQNQANMNINQEAPVVQSKEIVINATPQKVWKILTEIEKWGNWNAKINNVIIQGRPEVGVNFTWKTNGSKIKSTIHTYNQKTAFGWSGKTFGATAIHNWYLEPTVNGTKVIVEESMQGWLIKLMKKKMNTILEKDMVYWLEQLKIACEE